MTRMWDNQGAGCGCVIADIMCSAHGRATTSAVGVSRLEVVAPMTCVDWMTRAARGQAIPPAYTEFIGRQLMAVVMGAAA